MNDFYVFVSSWPTFLDSLFLQYPGVLIIRNRSMFSKSGIRLRMTLNLDDVTQNNIIVYDPCLMVHICCMTNY